MSWEQRLWGRRKGHNNSQIFTFCCTWLQHSFQPACRDSGPSSVCVCWKRSENLWRTGGKGTLESALCPNSPHDSTRLSTYSFTLSAWLVCNSVATVERAFSELPELLTAAQELSAFPLRTCVKTMWSRCFGTTGSVWFSLKKKKTKQSGALS